MNHASDSEPAESRTLVQIQVDWYVGSLSEISQPLMLAMCGQDGGHTDHPDAANGLDATESPTH